MPGTRLRQLRHRFALTGLPLAIAALVALPAGAGATVYCVDVSGGDCDQPVVGFQTALDDAASNPGPDTVRLGVNTYTGTSGGFGYSGNGPVAVIGSGQGQTTVTTPDLPVTPGFALNLTGPSGSSVSDLRLLLPTPGAGDPQRSGLGAGNNSVDAARVTVEAPAVFNGFGMIIQGGGSVTDSRIDLPHSGTAPTNSGIQAYEDLAVANSQITADLGINFSSPSGGTVSLRGSNLRVNSVGVDVQAGNGDLGGSVIETDGVGASVGNPNGGSVAESFSLIADGITIAGTGVGTTTGIAVKPNNNPAVGVDDNHTATIRNTIFDPSLDVPISRRADNGDTANVTTAYSDYDPAANVDTNDAEGNMSGLGSLTGSGGDVNLAPGFIGAGDYHLLSSSPLIDIGDPAAPRLASWTSTATPAQSMALTPAARHGETSAPTSSCSPSPTTARHPTPPSAVRPR